jgi:phospholipase/carboxylesterase
VATHLDRRSAPALLIGSIVTGGALGLAVCDRPASLDAEESSAEALVTHTPPEAWPPSGGDVESVIQATALRTITEYVSDGGVDAGPADAGPPIPLPERPAEGILARRGLFEDIHYLEVVLGGAGFDDPLPIVFLFHGRGGRAQLPGGPFQQLSHPVRVIVPQAPDRLGEGWEWVPVSVGSGLVDRLSSTLFEVGSRLAHMIRTLWRERPTVGRPIVTGFSQGGLLTYALALHHDDVVGHAFPLATWLPPPLEPTYRREDLRYPAIRSVHGADDRIIPVGPTRALVERLRARGFDVELHEFEGVGHELNDPMNALFHRWLERAVCEEVGDEICLGGLEPGEEPPVLDGGVDAGPPDAGVDAGRRRRRGRRRAAEE